MNLNQIIKLDLKSVTYHAKYDSCIPKTPTELMDNFDVNPIIQFLCHSNLRSLIVPKTTRIIRKENNTYEN